MYQLSISMYNEHIEFTYDSLGDLHLYLMELEHQKVIDAEFLNHIGKRIIAYNKEHKFLDGEALCEVDKNGLMLRIEYLK